MHGLQAYVDGVEEDQGGLGASGQSSLVDMPMEALAQHLQEHNAKFCDERLVDGAVHTATNTYSDGIRGHRRVSKG